MAGIDETVAAIAAARDLLEQAQAAVSQAGQEAEETQEAFASLSAESVAEVMAECKAALDDANETGNAVTAKLDEATTLAESART